MSKTVFKIVDRKGKVLIPQTLRQYLGVDNGDTVSLTAENGKIVVKKATVPDDNEMLQQTQGHDVRATACTSDAMDLCSLLELAARFIKDVK